MSLNQKLDDDIIYLLYLNEPYRYIYGRFYCLSILFILFIFVSY
jgi:hypothetical protein